MSESRQHVRLVIAGGGTGGHVLPAFAVLGEFRQRGVLADVTWIGSSDGHERQAARDAGIPFVAIPTGKLRRYLSLQNLTDAGRIPLGVVAARRALGKAKPQVVLSTGGFVSVPTVIAARGVAPVVTHEQTAIVGLANRINARFADVLAISHAETLPEARRCHRNVAVTGNPVRTVLTEGDRQRGLTWLGFTDELPVMYVTGGARGASPLNQRVAATLTQMLERWQLLHQTGPASANDDAAQLAAQRAALPERLQHRYKIVEFIRDELPDVYAAVDLIVGRAGAGTVAELALVGKPAILMPLPGAGGDEQARNAQVLANAGGAVLLRQEEATPERLLAECAAILDDPERRQRMGRAAQSVAQPRAAANLADIVLSLARS
ncbi:MAG: undecaprenyldiphospho-muramoylpentapeptide beta-N-acetylglucosaminyltransferase [Thermomicrobiales bacterium]|nr:undecaprenyldiphospho-muramoylpentapeptide beta-N-acetylglucosaminyltransferase [Thermomicrobiales bacterium]